MHDKYNVYWMFVSSNNAIKSTFAACYLIIDFRRNRWAFSDTLMNNSQWKIPMYSTCNHIFSLLYIQFELSVNEITFNIRLQITSGNIEFSQIRAYIKKLCKIEYLYLFHYNYYKMIVVCIHSICWSD